MKAVLIGATVAACIVTAACSHSDDEAATGNGTGSAEAVAAFKTRHEGFEGLGRNLKAIGRELKGGAPDVAVIQREAAAVAQTAPQVANWFPAGSGRESGARTRAKAEIWTANTDFQQRVQTFVQASAAFNRAAQAGDLAAIQVAMPALGDSCKQCHDRYRAPEH